MEHPEMRPEAGQSGGENRPPEAEVNGESAACGSPNGGPHNDAADSSGAAGNGAGGPAGTGNAPAAGQSPTDQNPEAPEAEQSPQDRIAALEAQLAEANDNYLRKAADFENYR
ncbi:MAG: hypothetical protein LBD09_00405, partial [Treponema sp.]|nr:hypothetical protein [Treponema sp.]